ncbi:hypothetical protein BDB01DRAFT_379197 [Pilobolus umbonatus]|nr:hypothetical protein BDB01DRAFT_379197 [Pilobolus umbonatus]
MIEIAQHLAPEQFKYEFPPKARLIAIAEQENNDKFSFFDESSFTTTSTFSTLMDPTDDGSVHHNTHNTRYFDSFSQDEEEETWQQRLFVADSQLSPLQLPTQASHLYQHDRHGREESYDSTSTIILPKKLSEVSAEPSEYLSGQPHFLPNLDEDERINWDETPFTFPDYMNQWQKVSRSVHPYHLRQDSEDDLDYPVFQSNDHIHDTDSQLSHSRVVVMKISKNNTTSSTIIQFTHNYTGCGSDEGYDDDDEEYNDCKELPILSSSRFLPLSVHEQHQLMSLDTLRNEAALKIQSVWRGHHCRSQLKSKTCLLAGLARINDSIHRRNNNQLHDRLYVIEQRLSEETRMRIAFEKAMEDMTILMDNQHKVLYERLEQEVDMRQAYERKMEQAITQIQPLESRLRNESKARADLESMMSRVLDQLHEVKQKAKEDMESRKALQSKLDSALEEIACLKKGSQRPLGRSATAMGTRTTRETTGRPISPTKALPRPTKSPVDKVPTTKRTITPSKLSNNNRMEMVTNKKPATPSSLRKTVINRKL